MFRGDGEIRPAAISDELSYEALVEDAPFGVFVIDPSSTIVYANGTVEEVLGYASSELVGESLTRVVPEGIAETYRESFRRYLETGTSSLEWEYVELPALHADGHEVTVGLSMSETSIDGERLFTGIFTDVSERYQLRVELEASVDSLHELYVVASDASLSFEEKRRRVLELGCDRLSVPYGFVTRLTESKQTIVASTGEHEKLQPGASCPIEESYCQRTVESDGFLSIADAVDEGVAPSAYDRFELGSYIGGKLVVEDELHGTLCFASPTARETAFTDSEGTFVEMASRWLSHELQHRRNRRRLERQNDRLEQFAGSVSHDLRNPLAVAKGRLELAVENHGDDEDLVAAAAALDDAEKRIEAMLEFARMGSGVTDPEILSLSTLAETAWERIDHDGATLVADDGEIRGDRERLERLFENLLRNSVEHGGSTVTVRVGTAGTSRGFYVADDGDGIAESEREAVFESGYTTSDDGNGFGLAIVGEIAAGHGWNVRVVDADGGGARFEFEPLDRELR